eukprot:g3519.t1
MKLYAAVVGVLVAVCMRKDLVLAEPAVPYPSSSSSSSSSSTCPSTMDAESATDNVAVRLAAETSSPHSTSSKSKSSGYIRRLFPRVWRTARGGDSVGEETDDREVVEDQGLSTGYHGSGGGATSDEGKQRRGDGAAAAAAGVSAAPRAAQPSECNSSADGGAQPTSGDARGTGTTGRCDTSSAPAGESKERIGHAGGQGLGLDSLRRTRNGWRIGEGIAEPAGGGDSVWHRLKELLEAEKATGGRRRGDYGAGEGGGHAERRRERMEQDLVGQVKLEERREAVVQAVRWAWKGYTSHAWGTDELSPLTRRGKTSFRLGLTIVDSMDTLWLAGEREEFARCLRWVTSDMDLDVDQNVNVFETTIRVLGGLLAAYHLSAEEALLAKATDLGLRLAKAFDSPSGIPYSDVNLRSGRAFNPRSSPGSSLSEATTLQLEFSYLSKLTGDPFFHDVAQRASDAVEEARVKLAWGQKGDGEQQGLAPVFVDPESGLFGESGGAVGGTSGLVTLGARGDSYYEYLLKQWLFSNKEDERYLWRYQEAVEAVEATLLQKSYPGELWFVGELVEDTFSPKMDHLVCFLPGTLALGNLQGAEPKADGGHLRLARELMETCVQMYVTETGLAPEIVHFNTPDSWDDGEDDIVIKTRDRHNMLRPETLESLYYMYWITREDTYREQAWVIFEAFEEHCRVDRGGYAGLEDVTDVRSKRLNKMETFFVSESLKYLYMIFSDENPLPLDRFVFNTEAHAFPI